MRLYLQNIVETIQLNSLPAEWLHFDYSKFSDTKTLYDYQQQALQNALKALYKYYIEFKEDKNKFFNFYKDNGFVENLDFTLNNNKNKKIFEEFDKDYLIQDNKIAFSNFINRMSFWMATGSGKTLVIVKLLELLGKLIEEGQMPQKDILFLTYREDLIEQFKNHIEEFNRSNNDLYIKIFDLKQYESVKMGNRLVFGKEVNVFYYRSDLISDEQKDKIISFRNYDNNGNWYIILDEAHKGDREESKRQIFYSILSRNGFLFNFSATFTDPIDFATCVFNFNLEKFIQQGYGKNIYVTQSNVSSLGAKEDFTEEQKIKTLLKILVLHTYIKKHKAEIKDYYHKPLILTLVNSVNTEDSDLFLFFSEIEKIAKGQLKDELLKQAITELTNDLKGKYEFTEEKMVLDSSIDEINYQDILENVFNSKTTGNIEVLIIPGNKQEIILKLKASDTPFALIKIGDITEWIRNKLSGYEINEKFDNESVFKKLNNDDSDINILMGSRAFYEGWDSNRPNIILYINIGKGTDARKFVLQSIGRGVRIEPVTHKRKRLQFLYNNKEIDKTLFESLKDKVKSLESLFVFGTKAENLKEVIATLKEEKQEELIGDLFEINPEVKDKLLYIPVYKESEKILADENFVIKFEINSSDLKLTQEYYNYIGDKVALVKYYCQPKILKKVEESFSNRENYYKESSSVAVINKPDLILKSVMNHFSIHSKEFSNFKKLENEIVHFKQIKVSKNKLNSIKEKIEMVKKYPEKEKILAEIAENIKKEPQKVNEYINQVEEITKNYVSESTIDDGIDRIKFKYLANHYYLPIGLSESERETYFIHIIKNQSEVNFIYEIENYIKKEDNFFKQFDWWYFSKIDETLDEVYIPYYQPKTNRIEKFKPDFIFWLKKGNDYTILFVDPKGTEHTDGYRKIDGFSRIFEEDNNGQKQSKIFSYNDIRINTILLLKTMDGMAMVLDSYKNYWFDNLDDFANKIKGHFEKEKRDDEK